MQHSLWRKGLVIYIIFIIVGSSSISLGQIETKSTDIKLLSRGNILYVGGSGPNNYTWIDDAINAANNGDTVFVYNGTYYEHNITIDKSIFLIGENKNITFIDGEAKKSVVLSIFADNVTVREFTIQISDEFHPENMPIMNIASDYNIISNNIVRNTQETHISRWHAIGLEPMANYSIFSGNTIIGLHGSIGIGSFSQSDYLRNHNITITDNVILGKLIWLCGGNNFISRNKMIGPYAEIKCMGWDDEFQTQFPGLFNTISHNFVIQENNSDTFEDFCISFYNCQYGNISWNTIIGPAALGIHLSYSINNSIYMNNISNCLIGIGIIYPHLFNNFIEANTKPMILRQKKSYKSVNAPNIISNNNLFRTPLPGGVEFINYINTIWKGNFWNRPRIFPKVIIGFINTGAFIFPARLEFDWRPAKEPYDIPRIAI